MILIFGCPEEIRITNFTRMPHGHHRLNQDCHTCQFSMVIIIVLVLSAIVIIIETHRWKTIPAQLTT